MVFSAVGYTNTTTGNVLLPAKVRPRECKGLMILLDGGACDALISTFNLQEKDNAPIVDHQGYPVFMEQVGIGDTLAHVLG